MPKPRRSELITGEFFVWRIGATRNGVFKADGRSNQAKLGRFSLNTRERNVALQHLQRLDRRMAVKHGLLPPEKTATHKPELLSIQDGIRLYMDYVARPAVMKGVKPATVKRYRAVFDSFQKVMNDEGIKYWSQIGNDQIRQFGKWLDENDYAIAGEYLMITTVKQAVRWLVKNGHLSETHRIDVQLTKSEVSTTYCYTREQVSAIVEHCRFTPGMSWLGDVIVGLAHTGLRISELAALRWTDFDFTNRFLRLPDRSRVGTLTERANARTTKGHRERIIPVHDRLMELLEKMKRHADGRVFHGPTGGIIKGDVVRVVLIREVLKPLASRFPSIPGEKGFVDGRLHSFRHFFCSLCADGNVPELMLMEWLGHKDSLMVKRYYHGSREEGRKRLNALNFTGTTLSAKADGPAATHAEPNGAGAASGKDDQSSAAKNNNGGDPVAT